MHLPVTAWTAAALTLLVVLLAVDTIRRRLRLGIGFGFADDTGLRSASRAHGNLTEYAPLGLILIGLLELDGAERPTLAIAAAGFVAARLFHTLGLYMNPGPPPPLPRAIGVVTTLGVLAGLAGWLVARLLG